MGPDGLVARLSEREFEMLELLAGGLSNEGIASRLYLSVKTVEATCTSVFRKLEVVENGDVNRRVHAAVIFRDAGVGRSVVPVYTNSFVGRRGVFTEITATVASRGLVTMVGAGGIGKTRVAVEVARAFPEQSSVRWVDLVGVGSADVGWSTLLAAFGITAPSRQVGLNRIAHMLRRGPGLVVFDNAESSLLVARELVELVRRSGGSQVLVTSRVPLGSPGEVVIELESLTPSDSLVMLNDRLRDRAASASYETVGEAALLEACRRLDGMPLALELLAGRVARMDGDGFVDGLARLPEYLRSSDPGRHGGLGLALRSSFDALDEHAREAFVRLSVLVSGFTLDAAHAVLGSDHVVIDQSIDTLVSSSLVVRRRERYRMLEPVRQYARDLLEQRGERDVADRGLLEWCLTLSRGAARSVGAGKFGSDAALIGESGNIDAGIVAAERLGDIPSALRLLIRLGVAWAVAEPEVGMRRAGTIMRLATEHPADVLMARAWLAAGGIASLALELDEANALLSKALDVFVQANDRRGELAVRFWLGRHYQRSDDLARARVLADELGDSHLGIWIRAIDAERLTKHERYDDALEQLNQARDVAQRAGINSLAVVDYQHALLLAARHEHLDEAARLADAALEAFRRIGDRWNEIMALALAVDVFVMNGDLLSASAHLRCLLDLAADFGVSSLAGSAVFLVAALTWRVGLESEATALAVMARSVTEVDHDYVDRFSVDDIPELRSVVRGPHSGLMVDFNEVIAHARTLIDHVEQRMGWAAAHC